MWLLNGCSKLSHSQQLPNINQGNRSIKISLMKKSIDESHMKKKDPVSHNFNCHYDKRGYRDHKQQEDRNSKVIKMKILPFEGTNGLDAH